MQTPAQLAPEEGYEWISWEDNTNGLVSTDVHFSRERINDVLEWLRRPLTVRSTSAEVQRWCLGAALMLRDSGDSLQCEVDLPEDRLPKDAWGQYRHLLFSTSLLSANDFETILGICREQADRLTQERAQLLKPRPAAQGKQKKKATSAAKTATPPTHDQEGSEDEARVAEALGLPEVGVGNKSAGGSSTSRTPQGSSGGVGRHKRKSSQPGDDAQAAAGRPAKKAAKEVEPAIPQDAAADAETSTRRSARAVRRPTRPDKTPKTTQRVQKRTLETQPEDDAAGASAPAAPAKKPPAKAAASNRSKRGRAARK